MVVEQIIVGSRIDSFGWRGTVRYVGEVAGTDGIWLGIDWDEPERGKHNGTYNGSQYFQASYPTSGSFVRPSKVKIGKSVIEAIEERYGVMTDPNIGLDQETILQLQRNIKATFFEVVGVSKLNQIQR
ncbi:hypothetical protein RUM43_008457 [Polyplax serrata]|uniref:CAP-Gly domain-containing protein n=1 Tax=Polyplax serrata TaxID=468196 RepID=A0AAN8NMM7_POLSC